MMAGRRAEAAVIGALLIDPAAVRVVRTVLASDDFGSDRARRVYLAALALDDAGIAVDYVTLVEELERRGELAAVGEANLTAAINWCPCSLYAADYARAVVAASGGRRGRGFYAGAPPGGLVVE